MLRPGDGSRFRRGPQGYRAPMAAAFVACAAVLLAGCGGNENPARAPDETNPDPDPPEEVDLDSIRLFEKYAPHFTIGAAVDSGSYSTHAALLQKHFNGVTTENEMKFESLQPTEGVFNYGPADAILGFAQTNGMAVRGHALVWHRQTPAWVFTDAAGAPATPELLLERLRSHITNVVGHFRGSVNAWDVVNEAMMDDGELRTATEEREDQRSAWHGILGESYIAEAFRAANAADPDAKLFYNDYYDYIPVKHQAIYEMLQRLLADGVPIHGVGMQCHLNIEPSTNPENQGYHQTVENLQSAIELYSSLGLEVHVTELDMSVYVPGVQYTSETFYTPETFTADVAERQAARYREFFDLFRRHSDVITNVTFWGIADDNTWLSEFSSGRKDFPLLFDSNHQPKPAFAAIVDF